MKVICDAAQDGRCDESMWEPNCLDHYEPHNKTFCDDEFCCPCVIGPVKCVPVEDDNV